MVAQGLAREEMIRWERTSLCRRDPYGESRIKRKRAEVEAERKSEDMSDIFIGHAGEDRRWARMLARKLEDRGWSVWWEWLR